VRQRFLVDKFAVGKQFERKYVDLLLGLLALPDHVAEVVVRKARLDAIGRIIGK
jgi:hypothetical protein